MSDPTFRPFDDYREYPPNEMIRRALEFEEDIRRRRTVREFSPRAVPRELIESCIRSAASAPSGANRQPWHFVAVNDRATKKRIRVEAEKEEEAFYGGKAPEEWLKALHPFGTDAHKPFLETAPWLIGIFAESYEPGEDGSRTKNYYVTESVGIATGLLIAAVHRAGLASLTHTPSPMKFLNRILGRPENERPFLVLVVGYPDEQTRLPVIRRKRFDEIATFVEGRSDRE